MTIYLLHFERRYHHAGHYLGSADDMLARLQRHMAGNGARLLEVITAAGINWTLARTWPGGRKEERKLKNQHNSPRLCPICNPRLGLPPAPDIPF